MFDFGVPITMVGLNVTNRALIGSRHLAPLFESAGPVADMVSAIMLPYGDHADSGRDGDDAAAQHDSLALAAVIRPDLLTTEHLDVDVDVENVGRLTSGMTVADFRGRTGNEPNCHVAVDVDVDVEAFTSLLVSRLTKLDIELKQGG